MNVIFDIADVLLDWDMDIMLEHISDESDRERAVEGIMEHVDWLELDRGNMVLEAAIPRFVNRTGLPLESVEKIMAAIPLSLVPNLDAVALLKEVDRSRHRLFCLSNLHLATWEAVRDRYDFWSLFEGILISCYVGYIKPEREIYEHLLNSYDLKPEECLFIDDRPGNISGARAVGINTLLFTNAADCRAELTALL